MKIPSHSAESLPQLHHVGFISFDSKNHNNDKEQKENSTFH